MKPSLLWLQILRLVTGLILLAFVFSHLVNLALGLVSLDAIEEWHPSLIDLWQTMAGRAVLTLSTLVHAVLGLYAIAMRRTLAFSATDAAQWCLALLIPPLLVGHILALRVTSELLADFDTSYGYILAVYWSFAPGYAVVQLLALMAVWTHGAIGLYNYLVLRPIWSRIGGFVTPLLFAVPILALLGFVEAGKQTLERLDQNPEFRSAIAANWARAGALRADLSAIQTKFLIGYGALAILALGILVFRILSNRRREITLVYDGGDVALSRRGLSILEFSLAGGVPHAHICGGRGRCGTCRVEVVQGAASLSPIGEIERRTLEAVQAPPDVRLACQARVLGHGVEVIRVLPPFADASAARAPQEWVAAISVPAEAPT